MNEHRVMRSIFGWLVIFLLVLPGQALADDGGDSFSRQQLTQMLAPVALYPDALLSEVLMAATYPLEVVEADRWRQRYPALSGDNLDQALQDKDWDASVKALCEVPTILSVMSEKLDETTNLGNAFLAQQDEVMDVIQELRRRAYQDGNLRSDDKQKVSVLSDGTIVIEPADPQVVYVPYYDTRYVYGDWWYPNWPPWYWGPPGMVIGTSIYFWPNAYFGFGYWSYFNWRTRNIIIDVRHRPRFFRKDYDWRSHEGAWHHNPRHRRGVVYRDRPTAEKYGQFRERNREYGPEVRGFPERHRTVNRPATRSGGGFARQPTVRTPTTRTPTTRTPTTRTPKVQAPQTTRVPETRNSFRERQRVESRSQAVSPPPARARETTRSRETYRENRQPQRNTIFSNTENGREETRSSIRGNSSWNEMRNARPQSFSSGGRGRERGGGMERGEQNRRRR